MLDIVKSFQLFKFFKALKLFPQGELFQASSGKEACQIGIIQAILKTEQEISVLEAEKGAPDEVLLCLRTQGREVNRSESHREGSPSDQLSPVQ